MSSRDRESVTENGREKEVQREIDISRQRQRQREQGQIQRQEGNGVLKNCTCFHLRNRWLKVYCRSMGNLQYMS